LWAIRIFSSGSELGETRRTARLYQLRIVEEEKTPLLREEKLDRWATEEQKLDRWATEELVQTWEHVEEGASCSGSGARDAGLPGGIHLAYRLRHFKQTEGVPVALREDQLTDGEIVGFADACPVGR